MLPRRAAIAEDVAVRHVVKLQQDVGIKTITDGEMRRYVCISSLDVL